jgi:hypothetical protein
MFLITTTILTDVQRPPAVATNDPAIITLIPSTNVLASPVTIRTCCHRHNFIISGSDSL